ncbi:hypothetical protein MKX03_027642, partial [Papaver bracteatum]
MSAFHIQAQTDFWFERNWETDPNIIAVLSSKGLAGFASVVTEDKKMDKSQRKTLSNLLDNKSVEDILVNLPVKSLVRF